MGQEVRTTFNRHVCIVYTRRTLSRECPRLGQVWTPPDKTGNGVKLNDLCVLPANL